MPEILAFVTGCLFTILLGWIIYGIVRSLTFYQEDTQVRRTEKAKELKKKLFPIPDGDVIKPPTIEELEKEKDETRQEIKRLLYP